MADISAERAWMRRHAEQQAAQNEQSRLEADRREHAEQLARCSFCFHERHHDYIVSASITQHGVVYDASTSEDWELAMVVHYCLDATCVCGVRPCPGCGDRVRPTTVEGATPDRCPMCGHEEWPTAYA